MDVAELRDRLQQMLRRIAGDTARLKSLAPLGGHSACTFGFVATLANGQVEELVLRTEPPGSRRSSGEYGRMAAVLPFLRSHGLPVPELVWGGTWAPELRAPFMVTRRLPGTVHQEWSAKPSPAPMIRSRLERATEMLAAIHARREAPRHALPVRAPADELRHWADLGRRSWDEAGRARSDALARRLAASPPPTQGGLTHGDYRLGNLLFDGRAISGILDWELAAIGAQELDLAWLIMFNDPSAWSPATSPRAAVDLPYVVRHYESARGRRCEDLGWFLGLAALKFHAIVGYGYRRHATRRRLDRQWALWAESAAKLADYGGDMTGACEHLLA